MSTSVLADCTVRVSQLPKHVLPEKQAMQKTKQSSGVPSPPRILVRDLVCIQSTKARTSPSMQVSDRRHSFIVTIMHLLCHKQTFVNVMRDCDVMKNSCCFIISIRLLFEHMLVQVLPETCTQSFFI